MARTHLSETEKTAALTVVERVNERIPEQPVPTPEKKKKKRKSRSKKQKMSPDVLSSLSDRVSPPFTPSRSIDSLFRNAYRAQLDMLALAATKANIMISLNGLLLSMLVISGTHFISLHELYVLPVGILLISCVLAIVFAVLAARAEGNRRKYSPRDFENDRARLLVFEEFSNLTASEYVDAMNNMLGSQDRLYENMITHIHELGSVADRSFRKLYFSYTIFTVGIVLSVLSLALILWIRFSVVV